MPPNSFSISISGEGNLIGPVTTEVHNAFPRATLLDRSNQFRAAMAGEQAIAGRMNAADRGRVNHGVQNLNAADSADIRITIERRGNREVVEISNGRQKDKHDFNFNRDDNRDLQRMLQRVVRSVEKLKQRVNA